MSRDGESVFAADPHLAGAARLGGGAGAAMGGRLGFFLVARSVGNLTVMFDGPAFRMSDDGVDFSLDFDARH